MYCIVCFQEIAAALEQDNFEPPEDIDTNVGFSPNLVDGVEDGAVLSPVQSDDANGSPPSEDIQLHNMDTPMDTQDVVVPPGAESTPPPVSPSPTEYPKIRIKTTGLLKEPVTITEITDENPNGDIQPPGKLLFYMYNLTSHYSR